MKRLMAILAVVAIFVGCAKEEKATDNTLEVNSTVLSYFSLNRSNDSMMGDVAVAIEGNKELIIGFTLFGAPIASVTEQSDTYRELQQKFGDINPNKSLLRQYKNCNHSFDWHTESGNCNYICFSDKINSVTVVSDKAWSADFPAGSDLSSLFEAEFSSLYEYVARGFTGEPVTEYKQSLDSVKPEWYNLLVIPNGKMGTEFTLRTTNLSENLQEHTLSIVFTLDTGEEIEYLCNLA